MIVALADVLVLGAGPGALAIAVALAEEGLKVSALNDGNPSKPWPYTYGIWGDEVDAF
ncbi:MAG: lycopene cyclase family protein, partial [Prochlorococcus sp.]